MKIAHAYMIDVILAMASVTAYVRELTYSEAINNVTITAVCVTAVIRLVKTIKNKK